MIDTDMLIFLAIKGEGAKGKKINHKESSYHKIAKEKLNKIKERVNFQKG